MFSLWPICLPLPPFCLLFSFYFRPFWTLPISHYHIPNENWYVINRILWCRKRRRHSKSSSVGDIMWSASCKVSLSLWCRKRRRHSKSSSAWYTMFDITVIEMAKRNVHIPLLLLYLWNTELKKKKPISSWKVLVNCELFQNNVRLTKAWKIKYWF